MMLYDWYIVKRQDAYLIHQRMDFSIAAEYLFMFLMAMEKSIALMDIMHKMRIYKLSAMSFPHCC